GIVVDPVYTPKAVAALIDMARKKTIQGPVLFWHTGGYHSIYDPTYTTSIWSSLPRLRNILLHTCSGADLDLRAPPPSQRPRPPPQKAAHGPLAPSRPGSR